MTEFRVGDVVILDRAYEMFKHGPRSRFHPSLYRAWGRVRQADPRIEVEWFDIPDGKSRGSHGAGVPAEYLIRLDDVVTGFSVAETPDSIAKRLVDMRRDKGTNEPSEGFSGDPVDSQTPSGAIDKGLLTDDNAGRGAALAHGDRQKAYGHPKVSFDRIARLWSTYLSAPEVDPYNLTAEDHGQMMNLLKISRSITDKGDDTIDDIEGYVTCIRMIRQAEAE